MTIKALIERLSQHDENLEVLIQKNHMEKGCCLETPLLTISKACSTKESFQDAFDGGSYSTEVKRISNQGDNCLIIN